MPSRTPEAIEWALQQTITLEPNGLIYPVTRDTAPELVDKVREYFNTNSFAYESFSYDDLEAFL